MFIPNNLFFLHVYFSFILGWLYRNFQPSLPVHISTCINTTLILQPSSVVDINTYINTVLNVKVYSDKYNDLKMIKAYILENICKI
jgi:hypothetical protein